VKLKSLGDEAFSTSRTDGVQLNSEQPNFAKGTCSSSARYPGGKLGYLLFIDEGLVISAVWAHTKLT